MWRDSVSSLGCFSDSKCLRVSNLFVFCLYERYTSIGLHSQVLPLYFDSVVGFEFTVAVVWLTKWVYLVEQGLVFYGVCHRGYDHWILLGGVAVITQALLLAVGGWVLPVKGVACSFLPLSFRVLEFIVESAFPLDVDCLIVIVPFHLYLDFVANMFTWLLVVFVSGFFN